MQTKKRIAANLFKIRHWVIRHGSYDEIDNEDATWFIDPPYQNGGHKYTESRIDFSLLGKWCMSRKGQAIVCENTKADWMLFSPMAKNRGAYAETTEAIWSNMPHDFNNVQMKMF